MLSTKDKVFYTYLWLREDGTPYYVGKGTGKRAIRKGSPQDLWRILIQEHESEADAFAAEIFLIAYYGRKDIGTGCLWNRTDGGDGSSGAIRSEETRRKIGKFHKGKTVSEMQRLSLRLKMLGRSHEQPTLKGKPWPAARRAVQPLSSAVHGTIYKYQYYGCRCELCKEAKTAYKRAWTLARRTSQEVRISI
jgi:hypothetical protein